MSEVRIGIISRYLTGQFQEIGAITDPEIALEKTSELMERLRRHSAVADKRARGKYIELVCKADEAFMIGKDRELAKMYAGQARQCQARISANKIVHSAVKAMSKFMSLDATMN